MTTTIELPFNWNPRAYQMNAWNYFTENGEGKRAVFVWHRRAGKDLFAINLIATLMAQRKGLYWHLLPTYNQGRKIVWEGYTRDGRPFLDHFPKALIESKNNTDMRLKTKLGSTYQVVGTDDVDRLVGTNPIGCVFSEYSLQDPAAWDYIRPILAENGGWALFIYTARGRNHGYKLYSMAQRNPKWFAELLIAGDKGTKKFDGTPVIPDSVIEDERDAEMPEEMIQQEFYCSFEAPVVGAYYGAQMMRAAEQGRICRVPIETKLPVHTSWDLGMGDATAIWFYQLYGFERRYINFYQNSGEGLAHYARKLKEFSDKNDITYGQHFGPHDLSVRELGSGKSRLEVAKELGIRFKVNSPHDKFDRIEMVRSTLGQCYFDAENCERGIEALRQYRKEWDDKKKTYSNNPLHDWTSHAADAFAEGVMGQKKRSRHRKKPQTTANSEYRLYEQ